MSLNKWRNEVEDLEQEILRLQQVTSKRDESSGGGRRQYRWARPTGSNRDQGESSIQVPINMLNDVIQEAQLLDRSGVTVDRSSRDTSPTEVDELERTLLGVGSQSEKLRERIEGARDAFGEAFHQLVMERNGWQEKFEKNQDELQAKKETIRKLTAKNFSRLRDLANYRQTDESSQGETLELREENRLLSEGLESLRNVIDEKQRDTLELHEAHNSLERDFEELRQEYDGLLREISIVREENERLSSEKAEIKTQFEAFKQKTEAERQQRMQDDLRHKEELESALGLEKRAQTLRNAGGSPTLQGQTEYGLRPRRNGR